MTAVFETNSIILSLDKTPPQGGEISDGGEFQCGEEVTIIATPNPNWQFVFWMSPTGIFTQEAVHSFILTENTFLTAYFDTIYNEQYKLTINTTNGGTTIPEGTEFYDINTEVQVRAIPDDCYEFGH